MHTTTLRKVGGSVMLTVPPALLDDLKLQAGTAVHLSTDQDTLLVKPARPRYTLEELLQRCDGTASASAEDRTWLDNSPVGNELL
ncbi:MAG: antitoxin [Lautropia sp.]|nr:antitoxin [Lautropia sp.]